MALNPQLAEGYHQKGTVQQERALENLSGWHFSKDDKVLDIGCGNGRITANISLVTGQVIGCDIDPKMVEFANNTYPSEQYPNLNFQVGDACDINDQNIYDKLTCFATLSWIPLTKHQQIFNGIYQSLKPEGKALLRMSSEGQRSFNQAVSEVITKPSWCLFFENFISPAAYQSDSLLREMCNQAGFNILRLEDATKVSQFKSKDLFREWLMTWEPHRNQVPESLRIKFMNEVIQLYCEQNGFDNDIEISLPGLLIEIEKPSSC